MGEDISERCLVIRSRVSDDYQLSEHGLKNLQHLLTDWFARAVYYDLTDDTTGVDVFIRRNFTGKSAFDVTFVRGDGTAIKRVDYLEERILGKACKLYDPKRTRYEGKHEGFDRRVAYYARALDPPHGRQ